MRKYDSNQLLSSLLSMACKLLYHSKDNSLYSDLIMHMMERESLVHSLVWEDQPILAGEYNTILTDPFQLKSEKKLLLLPVVLKFYHIIM